MAEGIFFFEILKKGLTKCLFRAAILLIRISKMALVVEVCPGTPNHKEDHYENRSDKASTE